jgi:hypothetical protein
MYATKKKQAAQKRPTFHRMSNIHARSSIGEGLQERYGKSSKNPSLLMPGNLARGSANLAEEEASFLRWLRENGGYGKRTGKNWMRNDTRLVAAGYVKAWNERSQDTVHYTLAASGAKALLKYESANPQIILSWRDAHV